MQMEAAELEEVQRAIQGDDSALAVHWQNCCSVTTPLCISILSK